MILITGGAYQGKLDFAKGLISDREGEEPDILYHMERYISRLVEDGEDVEEKLHEMMREHPDPIIICDEVGSGVIPIDEKEVTYRQKKVHYGSDSCHCGNSSNRSGDCGIVCSGFSHSSCIWVDHRGFIIRCRSGCKGSADREHESGSGVGRSKRKSL